MYRISWKSKVTGCTGNGNYMFTLEGVTEYIKMLNKEYPELDHWMESEPPTPLKLIGHRCSYGDMSFVPHDSKESSPS